MVFVGILFPLLSKVSAVKDKEHEARSDDRNSRVRVRLGGSEDSK
jgi:hypothetical protein